MQKSALLAALQQEIHRHDFSHFIDEPPSVAQGGRGVVGGRMSGLQEAPQFDEPVPRPSGERRDAAFAGPVIAAGRYERDGLDEPGPVKSFSFLVLTEDHLANDAMPALLDRLAGR